MWYFDISVVFRHKLDCSMNEVLFQILFLLEVLIPLTLFIVLMCIRRTQYALPGPAREYFYLYDTNYSFIKLMHPEYSTKSAVVNCDRSNYPT